jgi:hypothetical protein
MVYCIGHVELEITSCNAGESVWRTREEAKKACRPEYGVLVLEADWDLDTSNSILPEATWHELLRTAIVIER